MIELFGLNKWVGKDRHPDGPPDATDDLHHPFELKSTSKDSVSTARDFGLRHCARYRQRYWIVGKFANYSGGPVFSEFRFLAPCHMNAWLTKMEAQIGDDIELGERAMGNLGKGLFEYPELVKLKYILARGVLRNDPNIPWKYIERHGIRIDSDYSARLAGLIKIYPIIDPLPAILDDFLLPVPPKFNMQGFGLH